MREFDNFETLKNETLNFAFCFLKEVFKFPIFCLMDNAWACAMDVEALGLEALGLWVGWVLIYF